MEFGTQTDAFGVIYIIEDDGNMVYCTPDEGDVMFDNLKELRETDELKCVVRDSKDIDYISKVLKKYPTKAQIILSPLDNDFEVCNLIIDVLKAGKIKGRLGIQLHKILKIA